MPDGPVDPVAAAALPVAGASDTWRIEPPSGQTEWSYQPPGDRLASLCALACAALASGPVQIWGVADCEATISLRRALALLGAQFVPLEEGWLTVTPPPAGPCALAPEIDCGAELDTLLLTLGLVAGGPVAVELSCACDHADPVLLEEVRQLLGALGAAAEFSAPAGELRCHVQPGQLAGAELTIPLALQPLKPLALLLAMRATGRSGLTEAVPSPDHAERALHQLGVQLPQGGRRIEVRGGSVGEPRQIKVPPDIGVAAVLVAAASVRPGTVLAIPMTGVNPTRSGLIRCLQRAGADIQRVRDWQFGTEPVSELRVTGRMLRGGIQLAPNAAAGLLPEVPLLALCAARMKGPSLLRGARLLRQGVPDRLALAAEMLRAFGASPELRPDGLALEGPVDLHSAEVNCADDPLLGRLGLAAALVAEGPSTLHGMAGVTRAWPQLQASLTQLGPGDTA